MAAGDIIGVVNGQVQYFKTMAEFNAAGAQSATAEQIPKSSACANTGAIYGTVNGQVQRYENPQQMQAAGAKSAPIEQIQTYVASQQVKKSAASDPMQSGNLYPSYKGSGKGEDRDYTPLSYDYTNPVQMRSREGETVAIPRAVAEAYRAGPENRYYTNAEAFIRGKTGLSNQTGRQGNTGNEQDTKTGLWSRNPESKKPQAPAFIDLPRPFISTSEKKGVEANAPVKSLTKSMSPGENGFVRFLYVPEGSYIQQEFKNVKVGLSESGEIGIYEGLGLNPAGKQRMTVNPDTGKLEPYMLIGGGSRAAAQSGMFTFAAASPAVYGRGRVQEGRSGLVEAGIWAPGVAAGSLAGGMVYDIVKGGLMGAYDINTKISKLGAEAYGGIVSPIDNRLLGDIRYEDRSNRAAWSLAAYVDPMAVNRGKADLPGARIPWSVGENAPAMFFMDKDTKEGDTAAPIAFMNFSAVLGGRTGSPGASDRQIGYSLVNGAWVNDATGKKLESGGRLVGSKTVATVPVIGKSAMSIDILPKPFLSKSEPAKTQQNPDEYQPSGFLGLGGLLPEMPSKEQFAAQGINLKSRFNEDPFGAYFGFAKESSKAPLSAVSGAASAATFGLSNLIYTPKPIVKKGTGTPSITTIEKSELPSSTTMSGGNQTILNLGSWLTGSRDKIDRTDIEAVADYNAKVKTYEEMQKQNPVLITTIGGTQTITTTTPGSPDKTYASEWDKFVEGSGRVGRWVTGQTLAKQSAYETTIKNAPGLFGEAKRGLFYIGTEVINKPAALAPAAITGAAFAGAGSVAGGVLGHMAGGAGLTGTAARAALTPTGQLVGKAGIASFFGTLYGLGVTEGLKANAEKTKENVYRSVPTLAAMYGGGGGFNWMEKPVLKTQVSVGTASKLPKDALGIIAESGELSVPGPVPDFAIQTTKGFHIPSSDMVFYTQSGEMILPSPRDVHLVTPKGNAVRYGSSVSTDIRAPNPGDNLDIPFIDLRENLRMVGTKTESVVGVANKPTDVKGISVQDTSFGVKQRISYGLDYAKTSVGMSFENALPATKFTLDYLRLRTIPELTKTMRGTPRTSTAPKRTPKPFDVSVYNKQKQPAGIYKGVGAKQPQQAETVYRPTADEIKYNAAMFDVYRRSSQTANGPAQVFYSQKRVEPATKQAESSPVDTQSETTRQISSSQKVATGAILYGMGRFPVQPTYQGRVAEETRKRESRVTPVSAIAGFPIVASPTIFSSITPTTTKTPAIRDVTDVFSSVKEKEDTLTDVFQITSTKPDVKRTTTQIPFTGVIPKITVVPPQPIVPITPLFPGFGGGGGGAGGGRTPMRKYTELMGFAFAKKGSSPLLQKNVRKATRPSKKKKPFGW